MRKAVVALLAGLLVAGCPKKNHAPDAPSVPDGPSAVAKDSVASFSSIAADPDGDSVCVRFDWGDGDTSGWSQYVAPGESASMTYAWTTVAARSVRAQAKDGKGLTSPWSSPRVVSVGFWSRTFGGTEFDCANSVQQTSDGGYIIAGQTSSYGTDGVDVWLIRTDADGNKLWDMTFGGSNQDFGYSVQQTSDGGYIIAGGTLSYGAGDADVWLIKTDADGNKVWDRTFGGTSDDWANSVQRTADGGYVVVSTTYSCGAGDDDVWLIKTDTGGNKTWDKTFGGAAGDQASSVQQTSDGGYVVAGCTDSYGAGSSDVWLIRADADGNKTWDKTFGGTAYDQARSVQQTSDGGYITAGYTDSYGAGDGDVWLIRTDADGNKVWDRSFGGESPDWGNSVQQTSDGGYIIVGSTLSYGAGKGDVWLIKTDADGNKVWDGTFGGTADDWANSVQKTFDGGHIIAGMTHSYGAGGGDVWLTKTSGP